MSLFSFTFLTAFTLTLFSGSIYPNVTSQFSIDLLKYPLYVKKGFSLPNEIRNSKGNIIPAFLVLPPAKNGNRPVRVASLPLPRKVNAGQYTWKMIPHEEYTFISEFNLTPEMYSIDQSMAVVVGSIGVNWEIYLNNKIIRSEVALGENNEIEVYRIERNVVTELPMKYLKPGVNTLAFRILGDPYLLNTGFTVGQPYKITFLSTALDKREQIISLILISIYFAVGLYHLLLFGKRPQEKYNLHFSLFTIITSGYMFTRSDFIFKVFSDFRLTNALELSFLSLLLIPFLHFMDALFEEKARKLTKFFSFLFLGIFLLFLILPFRLDSHLLKVWQLAALPCILFLFFFRICKYFAHDFKGIYGQFNKITSIPGVFFNTLLHSISGNLLLGILTITLTAIFDILDNVLFARNIALTKYGFAVFILGIAIMLANRFMQVHKAVEDLNKTLEEKVIARTSELRQTLSEVQQLKTQQDADYFLTAMLLKPFFAPTMETPYLKAEFLTEQKKKFSFRHWKMEIGGDISIAKTIRLQGREIVALINADAMGKSIQGAGGALVLASVFQSIIVREIQEADDTFPEEWLLATYKELNKIFMTFDGSMLVAALIGLADLEKGLLYLINAEQPAPVLYRDETSSFIDVPIARKLGMKPSDNVMEIAVTELHNHDTIILGSDGRDDIILGKSNAGDNVINEDHTLFLKLVTKAKAELSIIREMLMNTGEIMDDLSLMKLIYIRESGFDQKSAQERDDLCKSYQNQMRSYLRHNEHQYALEVSRKAMHDFPEMEDFIYVYAWCLRSSGNFKEAYRHSLRLKMRNPDHKRNNTLYNSLIVI